MLPPMRRHSLALINDNQLQIEYTISNEKTRTHRIFLDNRLGNKEGSFDINGVFFSRSAREITLVGNILHATLSTSNAVWWNDQVAIDVNIPTDLSLQAEPSVTFRRCESIRLKPCRDLRLIGSFFLAAECLQADRSYRDVYFDLDICLGSKNDAFDRLSMNFSWGAKNIQLIGTTLYADLKSQNGTLSRASIELTSIMHVKDGVLKPLRHFEPEKFDFEVLKDDSFNQSWLLNAQKVRLVNYRSERRWYLIADCLISYNWIRESVIRLHDILGPHDDEMFCIPFFSSPKIPEQVRETKLENGILTASYQGKDDQWQQRSVNLAQVLITGGGTLMLKQFGSNCQGCKDLFYAGTFYTPWRGRYVPINESTVKLMQNHCVTCRLIHSTIKACAPSGGTREIWIVTNGPANERIYKYKSERTVEIVLRNHSTKSKLRNILARNKQLPSTEVRSIIRLELRALNNLSGQGDKGITPRLFRTLAENKFDECWLEPERRWSTIQEWIKLCSTDHNNCRSTNTPILPSRYLDVGRTDRDTIRLVTSIGNRGDYACLSHCWGGKNICTLNAKTEPLFSKAIAQNILPQVFTNAIAACRKLGIRNLWVDSLCIRQDSKEDWQTESQKMGIYYSNCTICIAATSSANSTEGFNISPDRPKVVRSGGMDPQSGRFDLISYPSSLSRYRSHFGHTHKLENLLRDFPLLTRAWVLQERWLAPRVLHFCGSEVVFECSEMTTCECGAAREAINIEDIGPRTYDITIRSTTTSRDGLLIRRKALQNVPWDDFVTAYSFLSLTQHTDRLVAISGVASTIYNMQYKSASAAGKDISTVYLAGVWRQNLARDLAWFVGESLLRIREHEQRFEITGSSAELRSRPTQYLAPSWSWASILDPVQYLSSSDYEPLFQLLDARISHETSDPFGGVTEGCYLHMRGKILESSWGLHSVKNGANSLVLADLMGTQQLDKEDMHGMVFAPDFEMVKPSIDQLLPTTKLYVFPLTIIDVAYARWMKDDFRESKTTLCLVLKTSEGLHGKNDSVYERVGFTEYANFQNGVRDIDPNSYVAQDFFIV